MLALAKHSRFFNLPPHQQILIRSTQRFSDAMPHWHDFIQLWYVLEGVFRHEFRDRVELLPAGTAVIVPPFHKHALSDDEDQPYRVACLEFSTEYLESVLDDTLCRTAYLRPLTYAGQAVSFAVPGQARAQAEELIPPLVDAFAQDFQKCLALRRGDIQELLLLFGDQALACAATGNTSSSWRHFKAIRQAVSYALEHYREPITLEEVSRYCQMSRCRFARMFKEITGNTFVEYLSMLRVSAAARTLSSTDVGMEEVMRRSGFRTRANFYRIFQYYVGLTPAEVRKGGYGRRVK